MALLELTLLGDFEVRLHGEPVTAFESNKVRALLAYLAAEADRPQRREALATLLWPDWPQQSALRNLSYALADLRKNIADRDAQPPFLIISRESLQLNPESDLQVDLWDFSRLASAQPTAIDQLKTALDLYRGALLEGFSLPDSAPFEEWLAASREYYQQQVLRILHSLAELHESRGEYEPCLVYARRQLELEPWREEAHQQVMRLLALSGQRTAALAQYEQCRQSLKEGLNVEPVAETVRLYEAIREGTFAVTIPEQRGEELAPAPGLPPFKGLQYFDEADASLFFGREALTARLVDHILEMVAFQGQGDDQQDCCFLAVVGASGSGKSSLVRAGLVPALKNSQSLKGTALPLSQTRWQAHVITPTAHPLEALAISLTRDSESVTAATTLADDMARDPRSLHFFIKRMIDLTSHPSPLHGEGSGYFLLVIDQFEELFTLCRSETERDAFLDNLMSAARGPALVTIALRADFYAHCAQYPRLRQALCSRQEYIGPMTPEELRRAIEEPARQAGWEFEPGLVDLILRDVGDEPGALPLLEHALLETWQRRSARTLTLKGYAAAGGVQGAIAHTAESVFSRLTSEQQTLARRIFLRLTELGEGNQDTRRRAALSELMPETGDEPAVKALLKTLADARLVTLGEDTAEVAHEALIREWPALRAWLNEDREGLRLHRRLTEAAQAWQVMQRDPGELYRGARLAQMLEWAALPGHAQELNALEQEFLSASQVLSEREAAEREAQRQRQLETARTLAESAQKLAETEQRRATEQTHAAQKLRRRAIYLAGALVITILMVAAAGYFGWSANRQATVANTRQFTSAALANLAVDPGQSIAQALQSIQLQPSLEAYSTLHQALFTTHLRSRLIAHKGLIYGIAVNPAGDRLATVGIDQVIHIWRLNGAVIEQPPILSIKINGFDKDLWLKSVTGFPSALVFSPDGRYLANIRADWSTIILNAQTGELVQELIPNHFGHNAGYSGRIALSPNGNWVASINEGAITIMGTGTGNGYTSEFKPNDRGSMEIAFSPDSKMVATGGNDNQNNAEVKISSIEIRSGEIKLAPVVTLPVQNESGVNSLSFSPDGQRLIFTTQDAAHILDLTGLSSGALPLEIFRIPLENQFVAAYYLPGTKRLVTAYQSGKISIWDAGTNQMLLRLLPELPLTASAVSPDGRFFFTAHANGEVRAWDISSPGSPEWLAVPTGGVRGGVVLSQDGTRLLVRNLLDVSQGLWDFSRWQVTGSQASFLDGFTVNTGTISNWPDYNPGLSRIVVYEVAYGVARVIDSASGELVKELQLGGGVNHVLINMDGSQLWVSRSYGMVDAWDIAGDQKLYSFKIAEVPDFTGQSFYEVLSKDETLLLTWGSNDPLVRLWKADKGQLFKEFSGSDGTLCRPQITPDNQWLLTCGEDQTVKVWEVASGKLARTIQLPDKPILVQVSPDLRYIVASLISSQTMVYDFKTGRQTVILPGSSSMVFSAGTDYQFSPNGKYILVTIPGDQFAYGFVLDNDQLVQLACQRLASISLPASEGGSAMLPICKAVQAKP